MTVVYIFDKLVSEQADKPVKREKQGIEAKFLKSFVDIRKALFQEGFENFDISFHSNHLGIEVDWKNALY